MKHGNQKLFDSRVFHNYHTLLYRRDFEFRATWAHEKLMQIHKLLFSKSGFRIQVSLPEQRTASALLFDDPYCSIKTLEPKVFPYL